MSETRTCQARIWLDYSDRACGKPAKFFMQRGNPPKNIHLCGIHARQKRTHHEVSELPPDTSTEILK